jgi:UDP-3-O-[3-hydroxymyristoyl] glucosamine N-acyltransferase
VEKTLAELAQVVGGKVIGDGEILIRRVAPIDEAAPGEITFLANPRYRQFLADSAASAIIVGPGVIKDIAPAAGKAYLESRDPYLAFARILQLFNPAPPFDHQVSRLAYVDPSALIADAVTIFPHVYVAKGA